MNTIAGVARVRPLPSRTRPEPSALVGAWFEAATPEGAMRLYANGAARHAVDAAVALARCETLLDALDDWLGTTLDWRWMAAPAAVTAAGSHARVQWRPADDTRSGAKDSGARIEMPWSMVRNLPAPDTALARQLHWPEVPVVLTIAHVPIGRDELAQLEPGGAVLLPDSMQPRWFGVLRSVDETASAITGVPVALATPWAPRRVRTALETTREEAAGARVACEVRLALPVSLPGDRLAGWFEGDLGDVGGNASLWRCATEREPAACLAAGDLMPWGDGWALALQESYEIRQTGR